MVGIYNLSESELKEKLEKKDFKVAVVGFGYIGCCIGAVIADKGIEVIGIDTRKEVTEAINNGNCIINEPGLKPLVKKAVENRKLSATTKFPIIKEVDVVVITVGTPLADDFSPILDDLQAASSSIGENLQKGHIVILKSTVLPFTTEKVVKLILEEKSGLKAGEDFGLAFCPERLAEGMAIEEFETIPIVVGGYDEKSSIVASKFWKSILNVETIKVSHARTAEMTKLADNLWIDLNIALGNELALICDKIDVDVIEVIKSANSLPKVMGNVNILMPSMGVGGYCLTKDPWFVHRFGKKYNLDIKTPVISRKVNDYMPIFTFELIKRVLAESGKDIKSSKVAVLGISFKSNTGDVRYTPTKYTIQYLKKSGCKLSIFDPWVKKEETKYVTNIKQSVSIEEAIKDADVVAFFTGHPEFINYPKEKLKSLVKPDCWIIDGRNVFDPKQMKEAGFNYKGIGR